MAETALRDTFREKLLKAYGEKVHYQRMEDKFAVGLPDANFALQTTNLSMEVWVEFKEVKELPKRETTPIRLDFRRGQVSWLEKRKRLGGTAVVVAKVAGVWMMFDDYFRDLESGLPLDRLLEVCRWRCGTLLIENLIDAIAVPF